MYTVGLYTLGCKVSQYETEAIAEEFQRLGFVVKDFLDVCDVYVINTCTVTREADRKGRQFIRKAIKNNPNAIVLVTGCYSQTTPNEIQEIQGVSYICGSYGKMKIPQMAKELLQNKQETPIIDVLDVNEAPFEKMSITHSPRTRAYVKIEDGCECRCTYCAIPGARGKVRSKALQDVIDEVKVLSLGGTKEVVLTGIETASYGLDLGDVRLIDLLEKVDSLQLVERIRLGSLMPDLMKEAFVKRLAQLKSITPHFHLSVQSGSSTVLARMKRRYNAEQALRYMQNVRDYIPDVQFTTDLMVGFPGETEEEFQQTLNFIKKARFLNIHVFAYSRRINTEADTYPNQVDEQVKEQRSHQVMTLQKQIHNEILEEIIQRGQMQRVLLETKEGPYWIGHTDSFIECMVQTDKGAHGDMVLVKPIGIEKDLLKTQLIEN